MEIYERTKLVITEFDVEDVITTSGISPVDPDPTDPTSSTDPPPLDPYEGGFFWQKIRISGCSLYKR